MYDNIFYCKCRAAKAIESVLYEHLLFHDCQILIIKNQRMETKLLGLVSVQMKRVYNIAGFVVCANFVWLFVLTRCFRMDGSVHASLLVSFASVPPVHGLLCMQPSLCVFACSRVNWRLCSK